jgi:hypothetical protein
VNIFHFPKSLKTPNRTLFIPSKRPSLYMGIEITGKCAKYHTACICARFEISEIGIEMLQIQIAISTIGDLIAHNYSLTIHCQHCRHSGDIDLGWLGDRLGRDHSYLRADPGR